MWHSHDQRAADVKGAKGFALPQASRHYAPDRGAKVEHLLIELWLDPPGKLRGRVRLSLTALVPLERLDLDLEELEVRAVRDGRARDLAHEVEDGRLSVRLPERLRSLERFELEVDFAGAPRRGLYFIGPSEHEPGRPEEIWTQSQDEDARHWFPCFDYPNQKATTEVIAHVRPGLFALSNGALIREEHGAAESLFHYRQDVPHTTYLVSLVVGEYVPIHHEGAAVPVVSYVHSAQLERGKRSFSRTAEMVQHFARIIGVPYPFPRYAQICVADFIFGGMENTSATTLTDQILFDERSEADYRPITEALVSHELAHQWWGDLLTCADWSHAWLNEGFATYFEAVWREHADGAAEASYARLLDLEAYFAETYRRPLVERVYEEPIDLFDRHQYEKGAAVLHLIRFMLGEEGFWRALKLYAERHRGGLVESNDLRRAITDATGRNLEAFFEQWVLGAGHPHLSLSGTWDAAEHSYNLTVEQTQKGDRVTECFQFPVEVELVFSGNRSEVCPVKIETRKQILRLPAVERPLYVIFDRGGQVPKQLDNRLPSSMLRALLEHSSDTHALVSALRALVKRGEPTGVKAVLSALARHPQPAVRAEAARALKRVPTVPVKDALVEALVEDGDPRVRRAAARSLGSFREHAEELTRVLTGHKDSETSDYVIADVLRAAAELRARGAAGVLERALGGAPGHNACIHAAAVEALAKLRDAAALPLVEAHTRADKHSRVREAAAGALGQLARYAPEGSAAREGARERLVELLTDPWLRVRMRAAEALRTLGDKSAVGELKEGADAELDGRARRAMRLAERELREAPHTLEEVDRLRDEVKQIESANAKLHERLEKLEHRRPEPPASASDGGAKKKEKKRKKKRPK